MIHWYHGRVGEFNGDKDEGPSAGILVGWAADDITVLRVSSDRTRVFAPGA
jgi:hypothetical protein